MSTSPNGRENTYTSTISFASSQGDLSDHLKHARRNQQRLETELMEAQERNRSLQLRLTTLQATLAGSGKSDEVIQQLREEIRQKGKKVSELQLSNSRWEKRLAREKSQNEYEMEHLGGENKRLLSENQMLRRELENARAASNVSEVHVTKIESLHITISDMTDKIRRFELELAEARNKLRLVGDAPEKLIDAKKTIEAYQVRIKEYQFRIDNLEKRLKDGGSDMAVSKYEMQIKESRQRDEGSRRTIEEWKNKFDKAFGEKEALQMELDKALRDVNKHKNTIQDLDNNIDELTQSLSAARGENDSLKAKIQVLEQQVSSRILEIEELRKKLNPNEELISSMRIEIKILRERLQTLRREMRNAAQHLLKCVEIDEQQEESMTSSVVIQRVVTSSPTGGGSYSVSKRTVTSSSSSAFET